MFRFDFYSKQGRKYSPRSWRIFFTLIYAFSIFFEPSSLATTSAPVPGKDTCKAALLSSHSTAVVPNGILHHGEHLADLILAEAESTETGIFSRGYEQIITSLMNQLTSGHLLKVNEKIDGSPSLVLGWTTEGHPFVAYKGELSKKKQAQRIYSSQKSIRDARTAGSISKELADLYSSVLSQMSGLMRAAVRDSKNKEYTDFIYQADLLFYGSRGKTVREHSIELKANTVRYEIPESHHLHSQIQNAEVGLVLHSAGKRYIDEHGFLRSQEALSTDAVDRWVKLLQASASPERKVFVLSPRRQSVSVAALGWSTSVRALIESDLHLTSALNSLPLSFRQQWGQTHGQRWRRFLNSQLDPTQSENVGGIFARWAQSLSQQTSFESAEIADLIQSYRAWLIRRSQVLDSKGKPREATSYIGTWDTFVSPEGPHRAHIEQLLTAFAAAFRIQARLNSFLIEPQQSILGGGPVEGLMMDTTVETRNGRLPLLVKWVDRLGFTLANNQRWSRSGESPASIPVYIVMKAQPLHAGHVAMIRRAVEKFGKSRVRILLSDKAPVKNASHWRDWGVAPRRSDLLSQAYVHVWSQSSRERLWREAFSKDGLHMEFANPQEFWREAEENQESRILIVGEKEIREGRYDDRIAALAGKVILEPIAMQESGISGTQIRQAFAQHEQDRKWSDASLETLNQAFSYVSDPTRRLEVIEMLAREWHEVHERTMELLGL